MAEAGTGWAVPRERGSSSGGGGGSCAAGILEGGRLQIRLRHRQGAGGCHPGAGGTQRSTRGGGGPGRVSLGEGTGAKDGCERQIQLPQSTFINDSCEQPRCFVSSPRSYSSATHCVAHAGARRDPKLASLPSPSLTPPPPRKKVGPCLTLFPSGCTCAAAVTAFQSTPLSISSSSQRRSAIVCVLYWDKAAYASLAAHTGKHSRAHVIGSSTSRPPQHNTQCQPHKWRAQVPVHPLILV